VKISAAHPTRVSFMLVRQLISYRLICATRNGHVTITSKLCRLSTSVEGGPIRKTVLNQFHRELGGKMVPFAGWEMPLHYKEGIVQSHLWTREKASLFDVSHMGQLRVTGKDRVKFIERLVVADVAGLAQGHATLSLFTNENGGIIDDTIIANKGDHIAIVVNAGCFDKDFEHIKKQLDIFKTTEKGDAKVEALYSSHSLLALQGPLSEEVLKRMVAKTDVEKVEKMKFMTGLPLTVENVPVYVQRSGYTGEDGFEISIPNDKVEMVARKFLNHKEVLPAGLGPRDTLRLEAGLCLYGHELNEKITPKQAALVWTIGKRRREEGGFLGAEKILAELKGNVPSLRVGLIVDGPPARDGVTIHDPQSKKQIGYVTSGTMSPTLKKPIAMGYVDTAFSKVDTDIEVFVRGKYYPAKIVKMPFVPTRYKK
jgi:aminomethyltransferase